MSHFICSNCGTSHSIFNSDSPEERAQALGVPFLGAIPIHPGVRLGGDSGRPVVLERPDSEEARTLTSIAKRLAQQVSIQTLGASS
jgi:ATP-binding protein involved in chromosome partitioning